MFRWIVGTSLQLRALVVGIAAAMVMLGIFQTQKMPVDVFPEFAAPVVEVQTEALGLSAEEVEALITLNLEELLSGVPCLHLLGPGRRSHPTGEERLGLQRVRPREAVGLRTKRSRPPLNT